MIPTHAEINEEIKRIETNKAKAVSPYSTAIVIYERHRVTPGCI
jgi:hypothetical protein